MTVERPPRFTLHSSITDLNAEEWNLCAGQNNPFVNHGFLRALEESGSTGHRTGWIAQHLAIRGAENQLDAVVPMYVKTHSYGEYVFDQGWAEAYERAGGAYYPKLQIGVPFSPVPGPRILRRPTARTTIDELSDLIKETASKFKLSSAHITFCTEDEWKKLGAQGWLQRLGTQFHWHNEGYTSFDDFLNSLSANHRKSIRRERRDANSCGLVFKTLTGSDIKPPDWEAFFGFYQSTVDRKWGSPYLTRSFFPLLSKALGNRVVLMVAEHQGVPVAGALHLVGEDTLFGRNWGCVGQWPFLHFELCYYRAIDYAIRHGLQRIEAGAQGSHKLQRGYLPQPTYSVHWLAHKDLSDAVGAFLSHERSAVRDDMATLIGLAPFKSVD